MSVLTAHICWSLESCEVKDLISLIGRTVLLAISWARAMAELVLLCTACQVCKAVGGGLGAMTLGPTTVLTDTCIQGTFQKLWKQQSCRPAPLWQPWVPLASSPCPLSPGVSNGNHLLSLLRGVPLPCWDHMLLHLCSAWSHGYQQKFFQASACGCLFPPSPAPRRSLEEHSGGVGQRGS